VWDLQGVNYSSLFATEYRLTDPYVITSPWKAKKHFAKLHTNLKGCNKHCKRYQKVKKSTLGEMCVIQ